MIHAFIIAGIVFAYKLSVFYFLIFSKLSFHVKILKTYYLDGSRFKSYQFMPFGYEPKREEDVFGFAGSTHMVTIKHIPFSAGFIGRLQ